MKKLMILGAGYSQLPLFEAAKRLGVYTVAASTPGDWPGFAAADEASYTDISDPEAVCRAARELGVDGVATCCLDTGVRAIGYTCEKLGLKGLTAEAGKISSDKFLMKEAFQKGGVSCAKHICVRSAEELETALEILRFPVILKAVDLMGSRGLFRCKTKEEALRYYGETMAATRKDYCLVEEFIEGEIFGCEAMMSDGKLVFCLPNNIEAWQSHVPTPIGHSVPYKKQMLLGDEVKRQLMLAINAVGLDNCPVNCDLIRRGNEVFVIEITGRAGATCLPEMVSLYYGIDYYEAIVQLALGMEVEKLWRADCPKRPVLARSLTSDRTGIVKAIHNRNEKAELSEVDFANPPENGLIDISFNIQAGEEVRRYENGRDRIGQVILTGKSLQECEERLEEVLANIHIEFTE